MCHSREHVIDRISQKQRAGKRRASVKIHLTIHQDESPKKGGKNVPTSTLTKLAPDVGDNTRNNFERNPKE